MQIKMGKNNIFLCIDTYLESISTLSVHMFLVYKFCYFHFKTEDVLQKNVKPLNKLEFKKNKFAQKKATLLTKKWFL